MRLIVRPLSNWHWPTTDAPRSSPFSAQWSTTLDDLEREMRFLGVEEVVLELDVTERDCRLDGGVRADARPASDRVVLSFEHPTQGPLRLPCDTYAAAAWRRFPGWQANVRAIVLALEALRAVDRHGVTGHGEQYVGWRALPASTAPTMTSRRAAEIVERAATGETDGVDPNAVEALLDDADLTRASVRDALKRTHPDRGGSPDEFQLVQTARKVLEAHHGGRA